MEEWHVFAINKYKWLISISLYTNEYIPPGSVKAWISISIAAPAPAVTIICKKDNVKLSELSGMISYFSKFLVFGDRYYNSYITVAVRSDPPTYVCGVGKYPNDISLPLQELLTLCGSQIFYVYDLEKSHNF